MGSRLSIASTSTVPLMVPFGARRKCYVRRGWLIPRGRRHEQPEARLRFHPVARIAGNILSGRKEHLWGEMRKGELASVDVNTVTWAVAMAREIIKETKRTEPLAGQGAQT